MTGASSDNPLDRLADAYASPCGQRSAGLNLRGVWALYALTLRQHLHGKRWMIMVLLFLLPAALAILVRSTARDAPGIQLEFVFGFMLIPQAVLPLVAMIYASGIIQDEQEEQTITYLLIRPISKGALYIVKLLATVTTTVLLTAVFTPLTYAAIYVGAGSGVEDIPQRCLNAVMVHSLAVVAYCCIFGLLSLLTKRFLLVGILYIIAIEGVLANFPFGIRLITVIYYTRLIAYRMMDFVWQRPWGPINMAADAWQLDIVKDPHLLEHPAMKTCLIVLFAASIVCTLLAAIICSQREFHVKTPEKA
ncbi:MAG TPA: ABC transporter permease [Pirellulales bacterium]|jgi:ABC-2 type transport system permease protein|nr:ABC transporter permease [Pirellulales bacterium]